MLATACFDWVFAIEVSETMFFTATLRAHKTAHTQCNAPSHNKKHSMRVVKNTKMGRKIKAQEMDRNTEVETCQTL